MDIKSLFKLSVDRLKQCVRSIDNSQWNSPTPCSEWNVHDLLNHLVSELVWVAPLLAGESAKDIGDRFDGDLLGDSPTDRTISAINEAVIAVSAPNTTEKTVQLKNPTPAKQYLFEVTSDITVHTWDLARAIGADETIPDELLTLVEETFAPLAGKEVFGDVVEVEPNASRQVKLLAKLGREA